MTVTDQRDRDRRARGNRLKPAGPQQPDPFGQIGGLNHWLILPSGGRWYPPVRRDG